MAARDKQSRRSRRRRLSSRQRNAKSASKRNAQTNRGSEELPQVFIYTYTIYKALE